MSNPTNGPSARAFRSSAQYVQDSAGGQFDIFEWHPAYMSCQKYFLDYAQHDASVQAVSALVNILLPRQWRDGPITSSSTTTTTTNQSTSSGSGVPLPKAGEAYPMPGLFNYHAPPSQSQDTSRSQCISLIPYIRRLIVTGFDLPPVLHGFFGDDWRKGVGPLHECERRNYLFAAKSGGWAKVKDQYDMGTQETVPFLQPPRDVQLAEIENAEKLWSQWLAVEDWMIGPRAFDANASAEHRGGREPGQFEQNMEQ